MRERERVTDNMCMSSACQSLPLVLTSLCRCVQTEVMDQLKENLPGLDKIVAEIEELASSGGKYQESLEVTLPMVCRSVS